MAVRDDIATQLVQIALEVGGIRDHQIHAQHIVIRKRNAAVDYQNIIAIFNDRHILADLIETTERYNLQFFFHNSFITFLYSSVEIPVNNNPGHFPAFFTKTDLHPVRPPLCTILSLRCSSVSLYTSEHPHTNCKHLFFIIPHSACSVKFFYRRWKVAAQKSIVCKPPIYTLYIIVFSCTDILIPQQKPFPTPPICTVSGFHQFPTRNRKMSFCNRSLCTNPFAAENIDCFFHASVQIFRLYRETII